MLPVQMGTHSIKDHYIPTIEIFNFIENYFSEYEIELLDYNIDGLNRKYIVMVSNEYLIDIHNGYWEGELVGLYIDYYLNYDIKGEGEQGRINRLKVPMDKMKLCLIQNFSEIIKTDDIVERFKPIPIH
jgi:hypothetical protein